MAPGFACGGFYFFTGGGLTSHADVIIDGVVKEIHILEDDGNLLHQCMYGVVFDILSA